MEKLVQTAKSAGTILKWAISIEGTADGTTRPWSAYNSAKTAYDNAVKAVNTLPAAQKNNYLAELDEDVKVHIDRTMRYIDAITAGEKIKEKQQALSHQLEINTINDQTENAYHELSAEIRKQAILLDRVYGQSTRDLIRSQYKQEAEKVWDQAKYPVTVKIEIDLAAKALAAKDGVQADKHIAEAQKYINSVNNPIIKKSLTDRLNSLGITLTPKVEKITAAEPKRIKVEFNKAMLAGSGTNGAENTSNYSVSGKSIKSVKLSEDKSAALIELHDPLYSSTSYTVTVKSNIQTATYEALSTSDYSTTFTFTDSTKPTVSIVTTDINGNLEIKFSELVDGHSPLSITIDGKLVNYTSTSDTDTLVVRKLELDRIGLQKGKWYSIVMSGARDLVVPTPNIMNAYSSTFFYNSNADTGIPEIKQFQVKDEKIISIEFSEALSTFSANNLAITKGVTTIRPSAVKDVSNGARTTFEIELPASVFGTNENTVWLNVQVKSYKDLANNEGKTYEQAVSLSKDLNPPTLVNTVYDGYTNEIQVTFNKPLQTGSPVTSKITIYDTNNNPVRATFKSNSGNKMIIDARSLPDGIYIIDVQAGAIKDSTITQNDNRPFATSVTKKMDSVKPFVKELIASDVNGQFKVVFSEPITDVSATVYTNYLINGVTIPSNSALSINSDKRIVTITLPEGKIATSVPYTVMIQGVKDPSDNMMDNYTGSVTIRDNTKPVLVNAVREHDNIKLTFSENIVLSGQANFEIKINDEPVAANLYTVGISSDYRELIITPTTSGMFETGKILIKTTGSSAISDGSGNRVAEMEKEI
ncbi:Ig-like domain-containing protein [Bacillus sp. FJAT-29937]|uniref:Ig-like domain-containing protein n=1 Tax=Bacillus sp. FJAT-29937 TaxID=1720553 RepID=UPI0012E3D0B4|nr:Ig-like domain-containing protein [Bacillus sp. FJAT-29937]